MIKIGMLIADRYEVLEKVGTGGMSDVYKAKDHRLNRMVAVKVLKQEFSENATFVSKFRVEAQAAAGLMHPNIVNVYDVGEEKGAYYIIMELVNGITLKQYIKKKERLSPREAVTVAIQVSMGLAAAHRNHIIHRDIKPQNIIISKEGKVKVTDFGIAKASTSKTITSNVMGSVHYTSPEQARGGFSDEKSDVYSLGVTLFEMLTGNVPYDGDTTVAVALQHIQDPFPSPRDLVPDLPYSVEQIVLKCCEKSPDRRYQTMEELTADLRHSLNDPEGTFVQRAGEENLSDTRAMTARDREEIRRRTAGYPQTVDPAAGVTGGAAAAAESTGNGIHPAPDLEESDAAEGPDKTGTDRKGQHSLAPAAENVPYVDEDLKEEDEEKELEEDERRLDRLIQILSVVAVVVIGIVIILVAVGRGSSSKKQEKEPEAVQTENPQEEEPETETEEEAVLVEVPQVIGLRSAEAQAALGRAGLTWEIVDGNSDQYEEGVVMDCSAAEGSLVEKGSRVTLTVVRVEKVKVPDVTQETQAVAEETLQEAGLVSVVEHVYSDETDAGYVERQNPQGDQEVPVGSSVTIYVSDGPDRTGMVQMPNVLGLTEQEAAEELLKAGLQLGDTEVTDTSGRYASGIVIHQSIEQGEYVELDTRVDLEISGDLYYSYSARIEAPRHSEDPDYQEGTAVTLTIITDDGETILNKTTKTFPYPVSFTGISCSGGTLHMTYTNIVREEASEGLTEGEDGQQTSEYGVPMEITRELTFTKD
ncbi:MAG: Stk1 family PASTA domain-containing Ser/Thr kinase [Eubacteriales bacterium]|nr:Stk1 family PASTA domain-containing Ser/Thr kinase [Eubacteriales bacterium]